MWAPYVSNPILSPLFPSQSTSSSVNTSASSCSNWRTPHRYVVGNLVGLGGVDKGETVRQLPKSQLPQFHYVSEISLVVELEVDWDGKRGDRRLGCWCVGPTSTQPSRQQKPVAILPWDPMWPDFARLVMLYQVFRCSDNFKTRRQDERPQLNFSHQNYMWNSPRIPIRASPKHAAQ